MTRNRTAYSKARWQKLKQDPEYMAKRREHNRHYSAQKRLEAKYPLWEKQEGKCNGCKRDIEQLRDGQIDHIVPKCKGGTDDPDNLQFLCHSCNMIKGSGTEDDLKAGLELYDHLEAMFCGG